MGHYSLGVDIGGTFTDIVLLDVQSGDHFSHKELTTPDQPELGVLRGVRILLKRCAVQPQQVVRVVHATTLFTNALIERRGAVTGMITTEGFRDVLEIGRERRYDLYDNFLELIEPLVPRELRLEVAERTEPDGSISRPLDRDQLLAAGQKLKTLGVESIAVAFLHSYRNPEHETAAVQMLQAQLPGIAISSSAAVVAEIREYERFSTTVANAYVKPLADRYISSLEDSLRQEGITAPLFLMQSNGGLVHTKEAKRLPVQLLESGPAAGALVAAQFGRDVSETKILAFDMGGTTAKLSVIEDGEPLVAYTFEAARQKRFRTGSGLPIKISTIELIEIGAGGGSIAHVDHLGLLKVGPRSAGSQPGPACYQKGGEHPTVTDANLCLGYLNPDTFAGGTMKISEAAAKQALDTVAKTLDMDTASCVPGVTDVVNENMAAAARVHIAERGGDAREYSLLVTGGGGPLHGYSVAKKLRLRRMLCPPSAGVASALGLLIAPPKVTRVTTFSNRLSQIKIDALEHAYQELEASAVQTLKESGASSTALVTRRYADLRFVGQGFELVTELPAGPYGDSTPDRVRELFADEYKRVFAITPPVNDVEIVNVRIDVSGAADTKLGKQRDEAATESRVPVRRKAYCPDLAKTVDMPVHQRANLVAGATVAGPAIVEESVSTLIVGSHGSFELLENGIIAVELNTGDRA
ncbi:Acetophenone carboxylase gamma subunit [Achromobacter veterisilvae]|uniref:Acetophenone carboxylase gamma subunit n=1 Tax=Achromobacter veterisilvae TaxID=2069367 RepID=A0A446CK06_9BURK|nr:hydantoinase/oxoprolinase family protein [Achromobacter veterisilvae]SSW68257.1 Acetophenone carboxylase gamma subunit [Achromobacter veterisilvae]